MKLTGEWNVLRPRNSSDIAYHVEFSVAHVPLLVDWKLQSHVHLLLLIW